MNSELGHSQKYRAMPLANWTWSEMNWQTRFSIVSAACCALLLAVRRLLFASTTAKSKRRTARSRAQQAALTIEKRVCQFISLHVQLASGIAQYFCQWPNSEFIVSSYCDVMLGSFQIRRDAIVGVDLGRSQRRQGRLARPPINVINKAKNRKTLRFIVLRCAAALL